MTRVNAILKNTAKPVLRGTIASMTILTAALSVSIGSRTTLPPCANRLRTATLFCRRKTISILMRNTPVFRSKRFINLTKLRSALPASDSAFAALSASTGVSGLIRIPRCSSRCSRACLQLRRSAGQSLQTAAIAISTSALLGIKPISIKSGLTIHAWKREGQRQDRSFLTTSARTGKSIKKRRA